jgi:micrococcal nuclease
MDMFFKISGALLLLIILILSSVSGGLSSTDIQSADRPKTIQSAAQDGQSQELHKVTRVIDGDTIDVLVGDTTQRIRLIGVNTPETVDPRKGVECFGKEASAFTRSTLENTSVILVVDPSQQNIDKYGRLLRYLKLEDGTNFNKLLIEQGYAYEYTYGTPYQLQKEFKQAQTDAMQMSRGLWAQTCSDSTLDAVAQIPPKAECVIKGNISANDAKIYHLPSCDSYNKTSIDESKGEFWFCTESEALNMGWSKARNC